MNTVSWSMVQISDLHIVEPGRTAMGVVDTAAYLERAVSAIGELTPAPDLVIATGDLVDDGGASGYRRLSALLAPIESPVVLLPGNHDHLPTMRSVIVGTGGHLLLPDGNSTANGRADIVLDGFVTVVGLDSSRFPDPSGHLDGAQIEWLDRVLSERSDRPAVIALHHPPFHTGMSGMDAMSLDRADSERLASVVTRHPQVERVCCGHVHRAITRRWAGTIAAVSPSVAHAVALDLNDGPPSWTLEPPALSLLVWSSEIGLVSHQVPVGEFAATPY